MMAGSVPGNKGGVDTHKLWKHVLSRSTEFAWLPSVLAEAFCLPARQMHPSQYGTLAHCVPSHTPRSMIKYTSLGIVEVPANWKFSLICQLRG